MEIRHGWSALVLVGVFACVMPRALSADGSREKQKRLVVVTFPLGEGLEADTVRSLVPDDTKDLYQLIPIDKIISSKRSEWSEQIQKKTKDVAERAREAALAFKLALAAKIWGQAADELLTGDAVALNPSLVASFLLEAGSASVEAGENYFALVYFRKAIAIDANIQPGPTLPPETLEVFGKAEKLGPWLLQIPKSQSLIKLCRLLNVDGMLWVSAGTDEQGLQVAEKILLIDSALSEPEIRLHLGEGSGELQSWISSERQRVHRIISLKLPKKVEKKKPWYKKWWVYAVAGGVLAVGGAVAGIVVGTNQDPAEVDIVVHH